MKMSSSWLDHWWQFLLIWTPPLAAWCNLRMEIKATRKASLEMFILQERKNDARTNIPVLIEILEDLANLQQAFIFKGQWIPGLEHRCSDIQFKDSGVDGQISVAERTHQLRLIAKKMIRNCRTITFSMSKDVIPETIKVCESIINFWTSQEAGKKDASEIKINAIGSLLRKNCKDPRLSLGCTATTSSSALERYEEICHATAEECKKFHSDLATYVNKEFSEEIAKPHLGQGLFAKNS